ncbi:MAG TPA: hypothetical protein VEC57_07245 [Candidatus Limnocylindrales bacterium]|nr:hypothetical protein [Candidatus Limnocylindrales bacterium]
MPERCVICYACGSPTTFDATVSRNARCDGCGMDLRCCRTCRFYDSSAYNECSEPSAERVVDKERANFCDYYTPRGATGAAAAPAPSDDAQSALENLFRKG